MDSIFIETGATVRIPFRKMFSSTNEALRDINKYKSYSNVYHSIYWFRETEDKWETKWKLLDDDEKLVRELIPKLKKAGAQGIVEFPLNKIIL